LQKSSEGGDDERLLLLQKKRDGPCEKELLYRSQKRLDAGRRKGGDYIAYLHRHPKKRGGLKEKGGGDDWPPW